MKPLTVFYFENESAKETLIFAGAVIWLGLQNREWHAAHISTKQTHTYSHLHSFLCVNKNRIFDKTMEKN